MSQLAILGHPTRGEEVIEILEMLGGKDTTNLHGECDNMIYIIDSSYYGEIIYMLYRTDGYVVFTIEEFLEKFPYKVGDKVFAFGNKSTVIDAVWNESINEVVYTIKLDVSKYTTTKLSYQLQPYKEKTMEVSEEFYNKYCVNCGSQRCTAEGEWLEECRHYKEETTDKANKAVFDANAQCCDIMNHLIKEETIKINIPKGYEFAGVDDDNQQVVFERIGCQYPKTYEECCKITNSKLDIHYFYTRKDKEDYPEDVKIMDSLDNLRRLLICRNAYWKIASEQMGLGKSWKPDFTNDDEERYGIYTSANKVKKDFYGGGDINTILTFPTEEMRDAFYDNFKDLIEQCKELL